MISKKNLLTIIIICISLLGVISTVLIILDRTGKPKTPVIAFYNINPEYYPVIIDYLEDETTGFGRKCRTVELNPDMPLLTQLESSPGGKGRTAAKGPDLPAIDFLFADDGPAIKSIESYLLPLDEKPAKLMPSSFRLRGRINNKRYAYPLELDHVEIAFRKDIFSGGGLAERKRIPSLSELEGLLAALARENFFPLMIAGADDNNLLDAVTALTLSLGGSAAVETLVELIKDQTDYAAIINIELIEDFYLTEVFRRLNEWKNSGILHPEWLKFSRDEVLNFAGDMLTAAILMRLSTHRTYPHSIIKNFIESPFPFERKEDSAGGIIAPLHMVALLKTGRVKEEAEKIISTLVEPDFQKKFTHFTGLAPTNSTAETMDKQASNLRFWGAASRKIIGSLASSFLTAKEQKAFAENIRTYLIRLQQ